MNIALGEKLISRLVTSEYSWWKKVLESKYISSSRHHLLYSELSIRPCSQIWKLHKKYFPLISANTSRIPRGGKDKNISTYSIMGNPSLSDLQVIHPLKIWIKRKGILTLDQISSWNHHDKSWDGWNPPALPPELLQQWNLLLHHLKGATLISFRQQDKFKWNPNV